ncbi:MAG: 1-acyl-sn-glycerol-3-phosphate acyltransferase [Bacteroidales bacterium]|nr:1-acyl-sn-glycerol-3-phosphate acyltransferase [Bacteroidales bacterium]
MFDDIRPYYDSEIPAAMQRIVSDKYFPLVCDFLFPDRPVQEIAALLGSCRTVEEFQRRVMYKVIYAIADKTTGGLSVSGMERLDPNVDYLFVSNHRDIMMDAAFLQVLLFDAGRKTSEITFGANLMQGQMVIDVGRSNKMFRIERPTTVTSARDFLQKSQYVSEYIRYAISQKKESVWIAQRNGRTKDGMDLTDQGIIKMFNLSGGEDRIQSLDELHIAPLSISYEWEPCDELKALELYAKSSGQPYIKKQGEDLNSILTGITQPKGRVHLCVCEPLHREELEAFRGCSNPEFNKSVAELIDSRIRSAYRLYPNNYIAADLLSGKRTHSYTDAEKEAFVSHVDKITKEYPEELRDILLHIYANPVL